MVPLPWLLVASVLCLRGCHSAPTWKDSPAVAGDLKGFPVAAEVRKALTGVKQMKTVMERREEEHAQLMSALRKCGSEKQEALKLMNEVQEHLAEEERLCQATLADSWDRCRVCLESNCLRVYAACESGWSSVRNTMEQFLWKIHQLLFGVPGPERDRRAGQPLREDARAARMEAAFGRLSAAVRSLFNRSLGVFRHLRPAFDQAFQAFFTSDADPAEPPPPPAAAREGGPGLVQLLWDLGFSISSRVLGTVASRPGPRRGPDSHHGNQTSKMLPGWDEGPCGELGQNLSGCLQFHERCQSCQVLLSEDCPGVPLLHAELHEALKLVNVSDQQYNQIVQMAQYHLDETTHLMEKMRERFGWVSELEYQSPGAENHLGSKVSREPDENVPQQGDPTVDSGLPSSSDLTPEPSSQGDAESSNFIDYVVAKVLQHFNEHFETW